MAAHPGRSVLSLQGVALTDRQFSAHTARLDLELPHGEGALVQVEDEHDAAMLVDLCLGLADPGAGEVRFLGSPDLIVVQDQVLDQSSELAVPMAQAISAACDRGATVLWITASLATQAAQFVQANHAFRLGDHGLVRVRRSR